MSAPSDISPEVWRCLRTKPKQEHLASRQLRHNSAGAIQTFCPRLRHLKSTARGPVWFVEALFPGYLFARADWTTWQRFALATPGVTGQVHFGSYVPEVPESVVLSLQQAFGNEEETLTVQLAGLIAPGEVVEIATGPFRGTLATVTRLMPARERIAVLIEFLGSPREVEVSLLEVLGLHDIRQVALI